MSELRAVCPECGSITQSGRVDPKFYVNLEKGVGYCHHCGFTGPVGEELVDQLNVVSIRDRVPFDQSSLDRLEPLSDEAKRYLGKRFPGASQSQLDEFSLLYSSKHHAIAIPSFNQNGLQGIKYRFIAPSGNLRYIAEESSQFGGYWIDGKTDRLLVVEGEFDAISARVSGFQGTILALQTNRLSNESIQRVKSFKNVFLALDNDTGGAEGSNEIKQILGDIKPVSVKLPEGIKDLNELLQKRGIDESNRFLREETRTSVERVTIDLERSLPNMVTYLSDRFAKRGDPTGYQTIDSALAGGLRPNEMSVIHSRMKSGKSTFISNLAIRLAKLGRKIAIVSPEMPADTMLYPTLASIASQFNLRSLNDKEDIQNALKIVIDDHPYLQNVVCNNSLGNITFESVKEWARYIKTSIGLNYLVLDHAGYFVKKMTDADENQSLAKEISALSKELNMHVLVVVQSPKAEDLSIQTTYGGTAWGQVCDNFFILNRDFSDPNLLKVTIPRVRYPEAPGLLNALHLFYDRETYTLSD